MDTIRIPAQDAVCSNCHKKGHFRKVCRGGAPPSGNRSICSSIIVTAVPQSLAKSIVLVNIGGLKAKALVDSGSSESFIHLGLVKSASLRTLPSSSTISMAASSLACKVVGCCYTDVVLDGRTYNNVRLLILPNLCSDVILGLDSITAYLCSVRTWWC